LKKSPRKRDEEEMEKFLVKRMTLTSILIMKSLRNNSEKIVEVPGEELH